jgi:hypothetical protein
MLREMEAALRLEKPLSRSINYGPVESMMTRINEDETFALDVIDFALSHCEPGSPAATSLDEILVRGGSVWEVRQTATGNRCHLVRRTTGPVAEAITEIRTTSERAHAHLMLAWTKLMGRNPDPSAAYREAVRAVEVVAVPVVLPNDKQATLGKVVKAIRDAPDNWTVDLSEATPEQVADMAAMIWRSQIDRHGTNDESVPLSVSQEQADAAVHVAISLVRLFAGGHITPT